MDMAQFGPWRFLSDTAREDIQEQVVDKIGRSAPDRQVSPDALWVNSLQMMLSSACVMGVYETRMRFLLMFRRHSEGDVTSWPLHTHLFNPVVIVRLSKSSIHLDTKLL